MSVPGKTKSRVALAKLLRDYGMLIVLLVLCLLFSVLTINEQHPTGAAAAKKVVEEVTRTTDRSSGVLIVGRNDDEDGQFSKELKSELANLAYTNVRVIAGDPSLIRTMLEGLTDSASQYGLVVTTESFAPIVKTIITELPALSQIRVATPPSYRWPTFLLADNIRNVANQITVIAIIAIGMTMVIITAGIDLSVGSLVALSAVMVAWLVGQFGGETASTSAMILAGLGAMLLCGATGAFSGLMITRFRIPPFIATLAMMQVAAGVAYIISQGKPIYHIPDSFIWLGRGVEPLLKIPYAVILMIVLYVAAHILMSRTTTGRYIYAVGGNAEAARLSGIRVSWVLFFVYTLCGVLAGLGGIVMASQLKSGAPTYGLTYELYVIAAVVVGGTSLSGGEGRIFGTLIGAFIIAVIQNGMNLTNVESYTQKVVLGLVILGAVLLDRLKQRGFRFRGA
jgi:ribose transport system permease protein